MVKGATWALRIGTALARPTPTWLIQSIGVGLGETQAWRHSTSNLMVERHQRRLEPGLSKRELRRRVKQVFRSYGRYYADVVRLPAVTDDELANCLRVDGYEHLDNALHTGDGTVIVMPHVGSWEWAACWLARIKRHEITGVVERLQPADLFDWFERFRREIGMHTVPLGPDAIPTLVRALRQGHVVALLGDRDIRGNGVEVEFFGETTTLPGGAAALALTTGAQVLPAAAYEIGLGQRRLVIEAPLAVERRAGLRDDVRRVTASIAVALERLIRAAPSQWHLLQPNWPSDRDAAARTQ
jgi:lauroyl/myristoyl acyltransferase